MELSVREHVLFLFGLHRAVVCAHNGRDTHGGSVMNISSQIETSLRSKRSSIVSISSSRAARRIPGSQGMPSRKFPVTIRASPSGMNARLN